ncbi:MAG: LacI family DNA-binding transcriptional regulator [Bacteroidota bacterium]
MRNPATLKKISDHLSVSISTVSRALKDHQDVSPETKRRVKELAEMLDYEPNSFAINLRKKHSDLFAVIVPEISSYFYHSFIEAVEEEARLKGFSIMILQSRNNPELESNNLRLCRYNHVAGVFIAVNNSSENHPAFKKMEDWDIPMVFFDKVPAEGNFNKVCMADEQAGALSAEKIVQKGHQHFIAVMGSPSMSITIGRENGIRTYLSKYAPGVTFDCLYVDHGEKVETLLDRYSNSELQGKLLFSMSDEILCGIIPFLNQRGLKLPADISLLTISNGFLPRLFSPQVCYIETNGNKLGKMAFNRMSEILDGKKVVCERLLDCEYFSGGSM